MKRKSAGLVCAKRSFTLVELLVVVSIIALLISILLPSLTNSRKLARAVKCQANLRSISTATFTYLSEYGVYPPSISNFADSSTPAVKARRLEGGIDWLGVGDQNGAFAAGVPNDPQSGNPKGFASAPRFGAIWPYVREEGAYLCPDDQPGISEETVLGGGGNGKYSYTMFSNLGLRTPENIPTRYKATSGGSRGGPAATVRLPKRALSAVPLFVEEHPRWNLNNGNMEGNFNFNTDKVVSRHPGYIKRAGIPVGGSTPGAFVQGTTQIGFGDGHVENIAVNFGFTSREVIPPPNGLGLDGIPYTAEGLLYHFGIEYVVIDAATGQDAGT